MSDKFLADNMVGFPVISQARNSSPDPKALDWAAALTDRQETDPTPETDGVIDDIIGSSLQGGVPGASLDSELEARMSGLPGDVRERLMRMLRAPEHEAPQAPPTVGSEMLRLEKMKTKEMAMLKPTPDCVWEGKDSIPGPEEKDDDDDDHKKHKKDEKHHKHSNSNNSNRFISAKKRSQPYRPDHAMTAQAEARIRELIEMSAHRDISPQAQQQIDQEIMGLMKQLEIPEGTPMTSPSDWADGSIVQNPVFAQKQAQLDPTSVDFGTSRDPEVNAIVDMLLRQKHDRSLQPADEPIGDGIGYQCQKCGHNGAGDADFCERCSSDNITRKPDLRMDKFRMSQRQAGVLDQMNDRGWRLLEKHRITGEPLSEEEVAEIVQGGHASADDFDNVGGNLYALSEETNRRELESLMGPGSPTDAVKQVIDMMGGSREANSNSRFVRISGLHGTDKSDFEPTEDFLKRPDPREKVPTPKPKPRPALRPDSAALVDRRKSKKDDRRDFDYQQILQDFFDPKRPFETVKDLVHAVKEYDQMNDAATSAAAQAMIMTQAIIGKLDFNDARKKVQTIGDQLGIAYNGQVVAGSNPQNTRLAHIDTQWFQQVIANLMSPTCPGCVQVATRLHDRMADTGEMDFQEIAQSIMRLLGKKGSLCDDASCPRQTEAAGMSDQQPQQEMQQAFAASDHQFVRMATDECPKCHGSGNYIGGRFTEENPGMCYKCKGTGRCSNLKAASSNSRFVRISQEMVEEQPIGQPHPSMPGTIGPGGHLRQTPDQAGESVIYQDDEMLLTQQGGNGEYQLYQRADDYAGFTINIGGKGYEFVRSIPEDQVQQLLASSDQTSVTTRTAGVIDTLRRYLDEINDPATQTQKLRELLTPQHAPRSRDTDRRLRELMRPPMTPAARPDPAQPPSIIDLITQKMEAGRVDPQSTLNLPPRDMT